jgi:tetratricopeptide (TPR) repeat protein
VAIWLGRRLAYLGRYRDAIDALTKGIAKHPTEARLYRHRGHRHITIRKFALAIADGDRAKAKEVFDRVLAGKAWTAFGFIAAEADVVRGF